MSDFPHGAPAQLALDLASRPIRTTSAEAYRIMVTDGKHGRQKSLVYACLNEHGPLTGRELDQRLAKPGETRTSYHKRLPELRRMLVIHEVGERVCGVTGQVAIAWDVTGKLPAAPPKIPTRLARVRGLLSDVVRWVRERDPSTAAEFERRARDL